MSCSLKPELCQKKSLNNNQACKYNEQHTSYEHKPKNLTCKHTNHSRYTNNVIVFIDWMKKNYVVQFL